MELWEDKMATPYDRKQRALAIKSRVLLSQPVKRLNAEEEKRKELYLMARDALRVAQRARKVVAAVRDIQPREHWV